MMRWLATFGLAVLVLAYSILRRVSDYAHAGQPRPSWDFDIAGIPLGRLAIVFGFAGLAALATSRLPAFRHLNFLTLFNSAAATFMLAAMTVILLKG
jgi:hypothetical protein